MHNGVVSAATKIVRQSLSLPADVASQVRNIAKSRHLSANRVLVELVEEGIEARKRKEEEFYALAKKFRAAKDPAEVKRLGDQLGRMVFG